MVDTAKIKKQYGNPATESWFPFAACRGIHGVKFVPSREDLEQDARVGCKGEVGRWADSARSVCRECPVQVDCLNWAIYHHEHGCWGGTLDHERRFLRGYIAGLTEPPGACPECGNVLTVHTQTNRTRARCVMCDHRWELE